MKEKITRYSNVDAHNAIKQLMLRGERLVVRFFSENTQYLPCALVGTDNVKAFKYVIYQNSFDWLMGYLMCGKSYMEDIDAKPIMTVEEAEHIQDFQFHVLEMFIRSEISLQFTPLFLDRSSYITGIAPFDYGKVLFKFYRKQGLIDYLREHGITI